MTRTLIIIPSIVAFGMMTVLIFRAVWRGKRSSFPSREESVGMFNQAAGNEPIDIVEDDSDEIVLKDHRQALMLEEEFEELVRARREYVDAILRFRRDNSFVNYRMMQQARAEFVKEWADVQVTLSNVAYIHSVDGDEAFRRVHDSNMSKLVDGRLVRNDYGKIMKPATYQKPDMLGV